MRKTGAGFVRAEDFVPAQRQRLRFIDTRVRFEFALPNYLAGQLLDVDAGIHFVRRAIVIELLVFVVGLDRDRRGVAGEKARSYSKARDVNREETEFSRAGAMLVRGEILEVKARRDLFENDIVGLRPLKLKRLLRQMKREHQRLPSITLKNSARVRASSRKAPRVP